MQELRGTFVVMVTPFDENEAVDYDGLGENIEWYIDRGVHGLIPLGSTGEVASLAESERLQIAEFVTEQVGERVPVCIGATAETTRKTLEYTRHAQSLGADAVLILPPYYFNPLQDEMICHYENIANNADIPIMLYNNPSTSGVDIQLDTVLRLAETKNIDYIKESTGDIRRLREIERLSNGKITTFCGCEDLILESFMFGAKGWVSVIANALPELSARLYEVAVEERDFAEANRIYNTLLPLCLELEGSGRLVQVIKHCMNRRGAKGGNFRAPRLALQKDYAYKLDRLLDEAVSRVIS